MRTHLLLVLIVLSLSCTNDNQEINSLEFNASVLPQKWKLVSMTGNFSGSVEEGEDMEWQETYILTSDQTFTKTRETAELTLTGTGTFQFFSENEAVGIVFTFNEDFEIIGNCTGDQIEYLYLDTDQKTLVASWWACDGPGLFYQRIE
ncbi:hypothetical protein LVD13_05095 [Flavobacteriaceae bacterium D16]|nr:hypothetical protein [Flavobacteriaceae bacterium D16]